MSFTKSLTESHSSAPRAVILAGSSNLHAWPISRVNLPIQFQKAEDGKSPFQHCLLAAIFMCGGVPAPMKQPLVCVQARCLDLARSQVEELNLNQQPIFIIEPVERGTLPALITATQIAVRHDRETLLLIVEAQEARFEKETARRIVRKLQLGENLNDSLIVCIDGRKSNGAHPPMVCATSADDDLCFDYIAGSEKTPGATRAYSGINFCRSAILLDLLTNPHRRLMDSCSAALEAANQTGSTLWLDTNIWSAMPTSNLCDHLDDVAENCLLRPVDFFDKTTAHKDNDLIQHESLRCSVKGNGHLVALLGCEDLEIVTSPTATLIRSSGHTANLDALLEQVKCFSQRAVHDKATRTETWGEQRQLDWRAGSKTMRLTVNSGEAIPAHMHNHRDEVIHVLSGNGLIEIDGTQHPITQGDVVNISRNAVHSITNPNEQALDLLEIRHGAYLSDADCIHTAKLGNRLLKTA